MRPDVPLSTQGEMNMLSLKDAVTRLKRYSAETEFSGATVIKARNALEQSGFAYIAGQELATCCGYSDLSVLQSAADKAPVDPYSDGLRRRYYRTAILYPWTMAIHFDDVFIGADGTKFVPYYQAAEINSEANGTERRFPPLPTVLEHDRMLLALIRAFFAMLPGEMIERRLPIRVGIHLIRLFSDGRRIALPSPNTLHTDGEPWTAITLIDRVNVTHGTAKSFVARRDRRGNQPQDVSPEDIYFERTLSTPLESVIVDDARVSHAVTGCLGADGKEGWRTSLLIDFSPMYPLRTR